MEAAPECVRCRRSEHEHLAQDRGEASDLRRRIWRALGYPCAQFASQLAEVTQAATGRWAPHRTVPLLRPATSVSPGRDAYNRAREALARRREAS